ncbi:recombinase family protein [Phenylobacterium sp.]|uniref:recombinase family protein n=1 Tax=Phenylobacterium sp. TaxID=1871053 RepID=UPI0011F70F38|nr:recombinase family protein [Phenylobacterium sp.]THD62236.1 MAG: HTH domain-containing protein [Phenylobacterium sp.]
MLTIGYVRLDGDPQAQAAMLQACGCQVVRIEEPAGPGGEDFGVLHAILDFIGDGDELVVGRLEHLGASSRAMLAALERLEDRGAALRVLTPELSSRGPGGSALRAALEAVAAVEPAGGQRPRRPAATHEIRALQQAGVGPVEIARRLGVSRMTVWRKLKALDDCPC